MHHQIDINHQTYFPITRSITTITSEIVSVSDLAIYLFYPIL